MTAALRNVPEEKQDEVAQRRLVGKTGGLGYLAAKAYYRRKYPTTVAKKSGGHQNLHALAVAKARQAMIDAGIIKEVS